MRFLNMASDSDQYRLTPDYGKPPVDLWYDFMIGANNLDKIFAGGFIQNLDLPRLWRSRLHLSYKELCAASRSNFVEFPNTDTYYSRLMTKLAWILEEEGAKSHPFPVILVGSILDKDSSPDSMLDISKHTVEHFIAALTAGLHLPRAKIREDSAFNKLLRRLEKYDTFLTFHEKAPVALYHFGHVKDLAPAECSQKRANASLAPRGIDKYMLDEVVVLEEYSLTKEWNQIVQRCLPTLPFM